MLAKIEKGDEDEEEEELEALDHIAAGELEEQLRVEPREGRREGGREGW